MSEQPFFPNRGGNKLQWYSSPSLLIPWSSGTKTDTIRELSYPALLLVVNSLFPPMLQRLSSGAANLSCSTSCSSFLISLPSSYMEHRCLVTSRMLINHVLLLVVPSLLPPTEQFHHLPPPHFLRAGNTFSPHSLGMGHIFRIEAKNGNKLSVRLWEQQ